MNAPPPLSPPRRPDWLQRHWKWAVPVAVAVLAAACLAFVLGLTSLIKRSQAYTLAVAQARENPAVVRALGEPITEGWWVVGEVSFTNDAGSARLIIPLHGPQASGTLHVTAEREAGVWRFEDLVLVSDVLAPPLDLLKQPKSLDASIDQP